MDQAPKQTPVPVEPPTSPVASSPQPATPPVPTQNLPAPKKKLSAGKIVFISIILTPLLILGYRLLSGWYYSPERILQQKEASLDAPRDAANASTKADLDKLEEAVISNAATLSPYYGTGDSYSIARDGKPRQQETIGKLTPIDGEGLFDGCYNFISYAGDKWNRYPVAEKNACIVARRRVYVWTGNIDSLKRIVEVSTHDIQVTLKEYSPAYFELNEALYYDIKYMSIAKTSNAYTIYNENSGSNPKLIKIYTNNPVPGVPPNSQPGEDNRYILQLSSTKEYQLLSQRDL